MPPTEPLRHLRIDDRASAERYTTPLVPRGPFKTPVRDRVPHGEDLLDQLDQAEAQAQQTQEEEKQRGVVLEFRSHPDFGLFLKSLENSQQRIELLNVREEGPVTVASVLVPPGKLAFFRKRIQEYINEDTEKGNAKHRDLVQSITSIGRIALRGYWTEYGDFPPEDEPICWEVWLRHKANPETDLAIFRAEAEAQGLTVHPRFLTFPDRTVVLVTGTAKQLEASLDLLDLIAELRLAKECPTSFTNMRFHEQAEWVSEAVTRIVPPAADAVAVCVLDSGVDYAQPLLKPAIDEEHALTCFPGTSPSDHDGHGSEMAGLSLYGDLTEHLSGSGPVELRHRLESVQILPRVGKNHPDLYGSITAEAVARIESVSPNRPRVFCLAVTTTDFRDRGLPSSWSAEIDQLAFGETQEAPKRLIVISGGNTDRSTWHLYPHSNHSDAGIHDPGQSWNALTVGAYTQKDTIKSPDFAGYKPVAPRGGLSPSSTTSLIWNRSWPLKPDVVMEGGNAAIGPSFPEADPIEDLQLLTTSRFQAGKLLIASGDTSAASALAARMSATIQTEYPHYWPETVRALMVHSAEWTPAMLREFEGETKLVCQNRLRCYGYGVPDLARALWCARNALSLVSQAEIQPYERPEDKGNPKTRDMHFYELPWPVAELQKLGEQDVTMRVTLSYFIEPSPGRRGWKYKHRYASHGLRFDVNRPLETPDEFRKRINKQAREEDEEIEVTDSQKWTLGTQLRSRGSLHSDWWTGPATDLARCGYIGVYPVVGWWRERPQFAKYNQLARYSLVVSIHTASQEVDLYTPVTVQLGIPTVIPIE